MKPNLLISTIVLGLLLSSLNYPAVLPAARLTSPCVIGRSAAPIGFWTWPANSHVNVYLRQPDFGEGYATAVHTAVSNWDAAAIENGSNVHFTFRGFTSETKTGPGDVTVVRGSVYDKEASHLALLQAHSTHNNRLIDYALVLVDGRVTSAEVLTNVIAHEIGHSLGLLDCYECSRRTTAMGLLKTATETNGVDGPTPCDNASVLKAYRALDPQKDVMVKGIKAEDSGEEPEADVTPFVRPPG